MLRQALAFERSNPRSLRSFINWFEENAGVVNREMDRSDDAVRVMTVHSAKGLEGNIVFLIDAHRPPNEKDIGFPLEMQKADAQAPESGRLRLLVGGKDGDTPGSAAARGEKKRQLYEEYRRLFYVATTRARAASRLLQRLAPELSNDVHDEWRAEVLAVLSDPRFGDVFGPGSRAEVAIAGDVNGKIVTGQIDRLILKDREILIVDYKTNRPPPKTVEETAPAYLAQMAAYKALLQEIYPDHQIACALLWTFEARLSALPESLLSTACRRWLAPG
jgi:ATP-dependent exoDNAse (exonuclease V) beta subunit